MKLLIVIVGLFSVLVSGRPDNRTVGWVIEPSSRLVINGASNVNQFSCGLNTYQYADTLMVVERTASRIQFSKNKLSLPVVDFDCGNKLITSDFQSTLRSEQHPDIGISFLSFTLVPGRCAEFDSYDARVLVDLSGKVRELIIRFDFWEKSYSLYHLSGKTKLKFSDFGLAPPNKVMGLIKVEDDLSIDFNLVVRPL